MSNRDAELGTVVVVDDDPGIVAEWEDLLSFCDYEVATAASGREGLDVIREVRDLVAIISDFNMPGMNGVEMLAELDGETRDAVRIISTGWSIEDVEKALKEEGIEGVHVLGKIIEIEKIQRIIQGGCLIASGSASLAGRSLSPDHRLPAE